MKRENVARDFFSRITFSRFTSYFYDNADIRLTPIRTPPYILLNFAQEL
ncbi:MAG: hypothetical protein AAF614_29170 [Chloroflexota bacterium]